MIFLDPTNDYAFKKIFGDEGRKDILISFLNSILDRQGGDAISDITLLNPHQAPHIVDAKETILDVRCHDQCGREYIVEMQVLKQEFFDRRILYYASKAYHTQLGKGASYGALKPVIFLGILDFEFTKNTHWLSTHRIYELKTQEQILTDFDFTFVELPKFVKTELELETIADKWVFFLKNARDLRAVPEVIREKAIQEAFEIVNSVTWSKGQLDAYENHKMAAMDYAAKMSLRYKEGHAEGFEAAESRIARALAAKGVDLSVIADCVNKAREESELKQSN